MPDAFHGVLADDVLPFHPVKEHSDVADVVVDGGNADRLAVIPSAVRAVLALGEVIDIEGVLARTIKSSMYLRITFSVILSTV